MAKVAAQCKHSFCLLTYMSSNGKIGEGNWQTREPVLAAATPNKAIAIAVEQSKLLANLHKTLCYRQALSPSIEPEYY
jgi:hypothetical protein